MVLKNELAFSANLFEDKQTEIKPIMSLSNITYAKKIISSLMLECSHNQNNWC